VGGKTSYQSIKQYEDKAYDKVLIRMPKGRKAEIQSHAESNGQSVNGFINSAIDEKMNQGAVAVAKTNPCQQSMSETGYYNAELFEAICKTVKQHGGDLLGFIDDAITAYLKSYPSLMKLKNMEAELYAAQQEAMKRVGIEKPDEPEKQEDSFSNLSPDEIIEKFQQVGRIRSITSQNDDLQKE